MRVESLQSQAISVLIVLLTMISPCLDQTSASLDVVVKDPTGALIGKAQVQLIKNGKSQALSSTNQRGEVRFNKVPAGRYQLHVEAPGFKAQDVEAFELTSGSYRREVTLEIDVIKVDVDVEEEAQVRTADPPGADFTTVLPAQHVPQLTDDPPAFENEIHTLASTAAQ